MSSCNSKGQVLVRAYRGLREVALSALPTSGGGTPKTQQHPDHISFFASEHTLFSFPKCNSSAFLIKGPMYLSRLKL